MDENSRAAGDGELIVDAAPGAYFFWPASLEPGHPLPDTRLPVGRRHRRIVVEWPEKITRKEWDRLADAIWSGIIAPGQKPEAAPPVSAAASTPPVPPGPGEAPSRR